MPDYQKLYHELFNGITDVIEQMQVLQPKAEELYISAEPEESQA